MEAIEMEGLTKRYRKSVAWTIFTCTGALQELLALFEFGELRVQLLKLLLQMGDSGIAPA